MNHLKTLIVIILLIPALAICEVSYNKLMEAGKIQLSNEAGPTFEITIKDKVNEDSNCVMSIRAATECEKRGYPFFDTGEESKSKTIVFCYKNQLKHGLGITFDEAGLSKSPSKFIVEHLNDKSPTSIQVGDQLVSIETKKIDSMAQIKTLLFQIAANSTRAKIFLIRDGKSMIVEEPLIANSFVTPVKDRWALRMKCP